MSAKRKLALDAREIPTGQETSPPRIAARLGNATYDDSFALFE
jgi:hypothetical protein